KASSPPPPAPGKMIRPDDDELFILVSGRKLGGWTEVHVVRGVERLPSAESAVKFAKDIKLRSPPAAQCREAEHRGGEQRERPWLWDRDLGRQVVAERLEDGELRAAHTVSSHLAWERDRILHKGSGRRSAGRSDPVGPIVAID